MRLTTLFRSMAMALALSCQSAFATDYTASATFAVTRGPDRNPYTVQITWIQTRFAPAAEFWTGTSQPATPQRPVYVSASSFQDVRGTPTMTISVSGGAFSNGAFHAVYEAAALAGTYNFVRGNAGVDWPASITPTPIP